MDPIQYQEILDYSQQSSKLQVSVNSSGNVVMVPVLHLGGGGGIGEEALSSPDDSLSQHVTTHIITSDQLQQAAAMASPEYHTNQVNENDVYGGMVLGEADENLADLQPEDSDSDDEMQQMPQLSAEQKKLEFMAAVNLVPPAVLEEIQRRQKLCRAEYGNWWDRQHSTDFCLVPKNSTALNKLHTLTEDEPTESFDIITDEYPLMTVEDDPTQVAAGPDAESMVEQITYLTSWPATAPNSTSAHSPATGPPPPQQPGPTHTVEVMTTTSDLAQNTVGGSIGGDHGNAINNSTVGDGGGGGYQITFQSIEDYANQ